MNAIQTLSPVTMLAASKILVAPENPRSNENIDPDRLRELAGSIRANGLLSPIIGYEENGDLYAVAGGRRTRAIHLLVEQGEWPETYEVPVRIVAKVDAAIAGITEQITQQQLTDLDELRVYRAMPDADDKTLASRFGKSLKAVRQRRAVLSLPEDVLENVWAGSITVNQAHGLTYLADDPEFLAKIVDRCIDNPRFDLNDIRRAYVSEVREWSKSPHSAFVTQDEYVAAGGVLQSDLFSEDEALIRSPAILEELALDRARDQVAEKYPGFLFIRRFAEDENIYSIRRHPGIDRFETDEEREEWQEIRFSSWNHDAEEEPEWFERFHELEKKADTFYPDDLKAMLGVAWDFSHSAKDPIDARIGVLPDDLEPLYAAGYLERPKDAPAPGEDGEDGEDAPEAADEPISKAMSERIAKLKAHAFRMDAIKDPNTVLANFSAEIARTDRMGMGLFSDRIEPAYQVEDRDQQMITTSSAWDTALEYLDPAVFPTLKPVQQRQALACRLLQFSRFPKADLTSTTVIRTYVSLDAAFFSGYKKVHLINMLADAGFKPDEIGNLKKSVLEEEAAKHFAASTDILPIGF